jgi:hypothetical protein
VTDPEILVDGQEIKVFKGEPKDSGAGFIVSKAKTIT